ncbi:hypothetical protein, partial [Pseudomonas sp.]|uniref:hypothetical protein n=1 Tax=Pseudomonas sp. TaxID=306 RepID=UPI0035669598
GFSREFFVAQQSFAAEAAPTGTHKPTDTIAPRLLRDSAASGRRGISYQTTRMSLVIWVLMFSVGTPPGPPDLG